MLTNTLKKSIGWQILDVAGAIGSDGSHKATIVEGHDRWGNMEVKHF